ncbi:YheU family protein [Neptunomonas concharum]|uniref:YheU family protein n=1 Tax=Neptunomonas concharum TaxID=1031538 RepID=A0A5P1R8D8_9GAMM|nr:YheU family protein [Neptunomonas concharum]QEQ95833.1 YheU family protein [Neptunomonas concharum]
MIIPMDALSDEALNGLIEEFVTRDGTDYGEIETSLAHKVTQVKAQLKRGDVVILYSETRGDVNIVSRPSLNMSATDQ